MLLVNWSSARSADIVSQAETSCSRCLMYKRSGKTWNLPSLLYILLAICSSLYLLKMHVHCMYLRSVSAYQRPVVLPFQVTNMKI